MSSGCENEVFKKEQRQNCNDNLKLPHFDTSENPSLFV